MTEDQQREMHREADPVLEYRRSARQPLDWGRLLARWGTALIVMPVAVAILWLAVTDDHNGTGWIAFLFGGGLLASAIYFLRWSIVQGRIDRVLCDSREESFCGMSLAEVEQHLGTKLYDGMMFGPDTYRGRVSREHMAAEPTERCFWPDDDPEGCNLAILVRDETVVGSRMLKG